METFVISVVAFALAMLFLSVGAIFGRRRLRGSCGGLAGRRDDKGDLGCACGTPSPDCTGRKETPPEQ